MPENEGLQSDSLITLPNSLQAKSKIHKLILVTKYYGMTRFPNYTEAILLYWNYSSILKLFFYTETILLYWNFTSILKLCFPNYTETMLPKLYWNYASQTILKLCFPNYTEAILLYWNYSSILKLYIYTETILRQMFRSSLCVQNFMWRIVVLIQSFVEIYRTVLIQNKLAKWCFGI